MKRFTKWFFVAVGIAALALPLAARPQQKTGDGSEAFARLKNLVGDWELTGPDGSKSTVGYELVSGDTVLQETSHEVVDGKPASMVTMYYLDGGQLMLTHYCIAKNQPTMRGEYSPESKTLAFRFVRASNLANPNDGHMHDVTIKFLDNDHFTAEWTFWKDQKAAFKEVLTYTRRR